MQSKSSKKDNDLTIYDWLGNLIKNFNLRNLRTENAIKGKVIRLFFTSYLLKKIRNMFV